MKKKYEISISIMGSYITEIEAENESEALEKAEAEARTSDYDLYDFTDGTEIRVIGEIE